MQKGGGVMQKDLRSSEIERLLVLTTGFPLNSIKVQH